MISCKTTQNTPLTPQTYTMAGLLCVEHFKQLEDMNPDSVFAPAY